MYWVRRSLIDSTAALLGLPSAARPTTSLPVVEAASVRLVPVSVKHHLRFGGVDG